MTDSANELGFPLFIRTDHTSAKHDYINTCKVESIDCIGQNIYRLIEMNNVLDLNCKSLYFREFIELCSTFTAFNGLPIAPERRYFVNDGKIICHHPYWPENAIKKPSKKDWKQRLQAMNSLLDDEISLLFNYATMIAKQIPGKWSIDFALGRDNKWYFIDMADARVSYHSNECNKKKYIQEIEYGK